MLNSARRREMRIALCKKCNFDCFFCHSEGLDRNGPDPCASVEDILALIRQSRPLGFSDITLTGGEPLLRHGDVTRIIEALAKENRVPDLTVVTNASIVPDTLVRAAATYPGNLKFNVSLHSTDPALFSRIVQSRTPVETVKANIARLVRAGVRVKVNTVVLNGINSGPEAMAEHLAQVNELGVYGVKFLELLVTPANREFYGMYYSDEAIFRDLALSGVRQEEGGLRTRVASCPKYPDLRIEITRCTCKVGCADCREVRDRQFDSELRYHPCFVLSDRGFDPGLSVESLNTVLEKGENLIAGYARRYGRDSPMLVHREEYVQERTEVFYETDLSLSQCEEILKRNGYEVGKRRGFHLFYCLPENPDDDWLSCRTVLKYGFDTHTPNKFEIISTHQSYEQEGEAVVTRSRFQTEAPLEIPATTEEQAAEYMRAFGYLPWFDRFFEITDFVHPRTGNMVSVDSAEEPVNIKVGGADWKEGDLREMLEEELGARAVGGPFTLLLADRFEANPKG